MTTIDVSDQVVVFWDSNGQKVYIVSKFHLAVITILSKLGLKESPYKDYATVWTAGYGGGGAGSSYQITYTTNQVYITNGPATVDLSYKAPKEPKAPKKYGSPDKDQRREWRTTSTKHSRNTGRKIGRR